MLAMQKYFPFAILIPTRNRPKKIEKLLLSIQESNLRPLQVIIVASGEDISTSISKFSRSLNITYIFSEVSGQIQQKTLGLKEINSEVEWILFLDDDLLLEKTALESAFACLSNSNNFGAEETVGIGFKLPETSRNSKASMALKTGAKLFGLRSNTPGIVLKSGHATSYVGSSEIVRTMWLNGASMWKVSETRSYGNHGISSKYAACEDLIFSYPIGKRKLLVYCPTAALKFQDDEKTKFDDLPIYLSALYWRYYFVLTQSEMSLLKFNFTQIARFLYAVNKNSESRARFVRVAGIQTLKVFVDSLWRKDARPFLESI